LFDFGSTQHIEELFACFREATKTCPWVISVLVFNGRTCSRRSEKRGEERLYMPEIRELSQTQITKLRGAAVVPDWRFRAAMTIM
jgi:hypothetical protein